MSPMRGAVCPCRLPLPTADCPLPLLTIYDSLLTIYDSRNHFRIAYGAKSRR